VKIQTGKMIKRKGLFMNRKRVFPAILVSMLALSFGFDSCDNGTTNIIVPGAGGGGDGPNIFTITGITTQLKDWSFKICVVGMYPEGITEYQALSDTKRIYKIEPGSPQYVVAGREVYYATATGTEGDWTQSGTLKSASSNFNSDWRGSGTFISYWLLQDNGSTYRVYKLKTARTISEGENTFVHAVNDFELVLTQL
jgi:hypothetical protein